MKLLVVSICKDEAETIGKLLDQIPKKIPGVSDIEKWVIDDGSTDGTADVAAKHGARVAGSGMSKKLAFRFREAIDIALARDADILVNIDGDLQFSPSDIPKLVAPIANGEADFVAADRFTNPETGRAEQPKNMPAGKYWGNKAGAWVTSKLSGQPFNDVTCGFRAYNQRYPYLYSRIIPSTGHEADAYCGYASGREVFPGAKITSSYQYSWLYRH